MGDIEEAKSNFAKHGFPLSKWLVFAETALKNGWHVHVYESQTTLSKYVYIDKRGESYKVRFGNHKPTLNKESRRDSDFYIGVSNYGCIRTEELIERLGMTPLKEEDK